MVFNEFPLPLTFYDDKRKQNRYKENITNDEVFDLWALNDRLIPFQFRKTLGTVISLVQIFNEDDVVIVAIKKEMIRSEVVAGYQYFTWDANENLKTPSDVLIDLPCDVKYYVKVTYGGIDQENPDFSEVISIMEDPSKYFIMEWKNNVGDIDPVYYGNGYLNRMYFDTFITKGIPTVELDTEKDGYGNTIVMSRRMINNYDFSLMVCPNYIVDAVNFMTLHDNITINTKQGSRAGTIENVTIDQDQVETLAYWEVTIKFNQPQFFFSGSCATPITPPAEPGEIIIFTGLPSNSFALVYDANN